MSAFDDEFGLFGEGSVDEERRSTLGARRIASSETVIDEIEPEDDAPRRRGGDRRDERRSRGGGSAGGHRDSRSRRGPVDPVAAQERAGALLGFLAKRLVSKPESVSIETYPADGPYEPVIELLVDPEDLGKVIGRSGRMAQALRTIVRATAEGRVAVDIYDTEEANDNVEHDSKDDTGE